MLKIPKSGHDPVGLLLAGGGVYLCPLQSAGISPLLVAEAPHALVAPLTKPLPSSLAG